MGRANGTLAGILVLLAAADVRAGIAVDATSQTAQASATIVTWSHTVGSVPHPLLIVGLSLRTANVHGNGVTYAGQALTQLGFQNAPGNGDRIEMWYLLTPPSGTANIVATISGSVDVVGGAVSFTGVDPSAPLGTFVSATGSGTSATVTVSTANGWLVVDTLSADGDAISQSPGAGQTARWNTGTGTAGGNVRGAGSTKAGAASVTMSWTLAASKPWALGAVPLKPKRRVIVN